MFPINFNFPFRKKDGSISTIGDEINSGGGGGYELPTASAETKGGIKIGSGLSMSGEVLNNSNPTPYTLPTASAETLGGIKVGSGLSIVDGVLSAAGGGSSVHLFRLVGNQYMVLKAYVLTTVDASITNYETLATALQSGVGIVYKGYYSSASGKAQPYLLSYEDGYNRLTYVNSEETNDYYSRTIVNDTITFTCTKIF